MNNLFILIKRIKLLPLTAFLVLLAAISCSKEPSEVFEPKDDLLTTQTAQTWFEQHSLYKSEARLKYVRFTNLAPVWEKAVEGQTDQGQKFVEIPLKSSKNIKWVYSQETHLASTELNNLSMVIFKEGGQTKETVKETLPDDDYTRMYGGEVNRNNFSGKILTWSWSGQLLGGSYYKNGKKESALKPVSSISDPNARKKELICNIYKVCYWSSFCQESGNFNFYSTSTTSSNSTCVYPTYGHGSTDEYYCSTWEFTTSDTYQQCYDTNPPGTGEGGVGTVTPGAGITNPQFVGIYSVDYSTDPIKNRIFKLTGSVTITNRCQHQAVRAYLLKAQDLENDYMSKIRSCGIQNNVSGEAISALAAGISFTSIAQYMASVGSGITFSAAARGLIYGQVYNNLNLNSCILVAQNEIATEITKAHDAYIDAYNQQCP